MTRCLGVVRLSRETDETTSPERQEAILRGWCEMHGAELVHIVKDIDVSGMRYRPEDRPEFGEWLRPERLDQYDTIIGWKIDRIAPRLVDFARLIAPVASGGYAKRVVAPDDGVDTATPMGSFMAHMVALFAQFERETIAQRIKSSMAYLRLSGRWAGGTVPYGYRAVKLRSGEGWTIQPDPEQSKRVVEMADHVLQGRSLNSIAQALNAAGVPPPKPQWVKGDAPVSWRSDSIKKILRNRKMIGEASHDGKVIRDDNGQPVQFGKPILTRAKWQAVIQALDSKSRGAGRSKNTSPLLDVAFCAKCERKLYAGYGGNRGSKAYYVCSGRTSRSGRPCNAASIDGPWLEGEVLNAVLTAIGNVPFTEKVYVGGEDYADRVQEITDLLAELRAERQAGRYRGERGAVEYAEMYDALETERAELDSKPAVSAHYEYIPTGKTVAQALSDARTAPERRRVMLDLGLRVLAAKDSIQLDIPAAVSGQTPRVEAGRLVGPAPVLGQRKATP